MGGTDDLKRLLSDVFKLKNKPGVPEFFGFESWRSWPSRKLKKVRMCAHLCSLWSSTGSENYWAAVSSAQGTEEASDVILFNGT